MNSRKTALPLVKLSEEAKKRGSTTERAEQVDVYVVLRVHGEFYVTSFWRAAVATAEELWDAILEYVAVDVQWWCEDQEKPIDAEALVRPVLYQLDPSLESLVQIQERSQMQAYCDTVEARKLPLAVFSTTPDPAMLEQLQNRYAQVTGNVVPWRLSSLG